MSRAFHCLAVCLGFIVITSCGCKRPASGRAAGRESGSLRPSTTRTPSERSSGSRSRSERTYGSGAEVADWVGKSGVKPKLENCENLKAGGSITRAIACTTPMTRADAERIAKHFALKAGVSPHSTRAGGCESRAGFSASDPGVEIWGGHWGCAPPPRQFGYLEIHFVKKTGQACVETEYNWSC